MKNRLSILISVICLTVFVVIASFISVFASADTKEQAVVLREKDGTVALYKGDEIIKVYDEIVISVLPDADREMLRSGIVIENDQQLSRIIEDYDG